MSYKIVRAAKNNINRIVKVFKIVRASGTTGTGLPVGGTINQMIRKTSSAVNFASEWFTIVAATVGLGNVTDDAQLKRSAGDFQAFPQKITPAAGDSVLIEDGSDGENKKRVDIADFLGGGGDIDWANPISITGTDTLTIGKHHVCSGTTVDYTATLPPVAGNAGLLLSVEMAPTLTKLITIDGNSSETIDGELTRIMWAKETAVLLCDGTTWTKVYGKSIPLQYSAERTSSRSVVDGNVVQIQMNSFFNVSLEAMKVSGYCLILRPSRYVISGMISYEKIGSSQLGKETYCGLAKNSTSAFSTEPSSLNLMPSSVSGTTTFGHPSVSDARDLIAGDFIALIALQLWGVTAQTRIADVVRPHLIVTEIPTW